MGATTFYKTPAEVINKERFMASVPQAFQPNMPPALRNGRGRTIVDYSTTHVKQTMPVTITQMLDMEEMGYEFHIFNNEDIYNIFTTIDFYLWESREYLARRSMPHILFCQKLCRFRENNFVNFQLAVLNTDGIMNLMLSREDDDTLFSALFLDDESGLTRTTKQEKVKAIIRRMRKPPVDMSLLEISDGALPAVAGDSLDDLIPKDEGSVDEDYISSLFGGAS